MSPCHSSGFTSDGHQSTTVQIPLAAPSGYKTNGFPDARPQSNHDIDRKKIVLELSLQPLL